MMDVETKKAVCARLRRIVGQVQEVERMVDADRCGIELTSQPAAVQAAPSKAGKGVLRSHGEIRASDAIRSDDERACARKVEELVAVLGRYKRPRKQ